MVLHPQDKAFILLTAIFIAGLVIASVLASKIIMVFRLAVPAGVIAYSITFVTTDVISEIWGKVRANWVVFSGFIAMIVVVFLVQVAIHLPSAPFWPHQNAFNTILNSTTRIIFASVIAYLVSQFHDVWMFHFWKRRTQSRHLWLRNNLSTIGSQLLDTVIFIFIAFYGVMPIWPLVWGQFVVKLGIALLDTPVVYGVVAWVRKVSIN
ncbi:queuosine precursor transporter [candidate division KSB1 bacterium]|nr:queuosine precursor transporter [candidate division KSB1 bacterium]